jgi:hypothetical protein
VSCSKLAAVARLLRALAAVLSGNALYFLLLAPRLPEWWRHRPFELDPGLLLDFVICLAIYFGLGLMTRPGRHSG